MYSYKGAVIGEVLAALDVGKSMNFRVDFKILEMILGKDCEHYILQALLILLRRGTIIKEEEFHNQWGKKHFFRLSQ